MTSQTSFLIKVIRPWALILYLLTFGLSPAHAEPGMTDITVDANENFLILNASLTDAFSEKLMEVVESGVPLTFTYQIELLKHVSILADDVISTNEVTNTVHYDTLKKVFVFTS